MCPLMRNDEQPAVERWLSWSKAHDWKSCVPFKGTEGSNPSLSAIEDKCEPDPGVYSRGGVRICFSVALRRIKCQRK